MNQIGKDTLPQMLALLERATLLVAPDSGPAHMATMVRTPVIGPLCRDQSGAQRAVSLASVVRECLRGSGSSIPRQTAGKAAVDGKDRGTRRDGSHHRRAGDSRRSTRPCGTRSASAAS